MGKKEILPKEEYCTDSREYMRQDNTTEKHQKLAGEREKFGEYAAKAKLDKDGYVDVIIHASGSSMQVMVNGEWKAVTSAQLNDWLDERGYDGSPIRLISCGIGSDTSKIAQEVATQLNVKVKAPTDTVWAYPNGRLVVGPDASKNTGDWNVFEPKTEIK